MDIDNFIAATEAGELPWYLERASIGPYGVLETSYVCSIREYEVEVSVENDKLKVIKDGRPIETVAGVSGLVTSIETYLDTETTADAKIFDDLFAEMFAAAIAAYQAKIGGP